VATAAGVQPNTQIDIRSQRTLLGIVIAII
jgi:hypothetical protein